MLISIIVGMKYIKKIDKLLGKESAGFINMLPIRAVIVNVIAINTENQEANSGLGIFDLYIFSKILPIQKRLITAKNEIEYTQANNLTFHFVINKIEIQRSKNIVIIL
jgi:hypothetical protein